MYLSPPETRSKQTKRAKNFQTLGVRIVKILWHRPNREKMRIVGRDASHTLAYIPQRRTYTIRPTKKSHKYIYTGKAINNSGLRQSGSRTFFRVCIFLERVKQGLLLVCTLRLGTPNFQVWMGRLWFEAFIWWAML